jgi:hypothetical protein
MARPCDSRWPAPLDSVLSIGDERNTIPNGRIRPLMVHTWDVPSPRANITGDSRPREVFRGHVVFRCFRFAPQPETPLALAKRLQITVVSAGYRVRSHVNEWRPIDEQDPSRPRSLDRLRRIAETSAHCPERR